MAQTHPGGAVAAANAFLDTNGALEIPRSKARIRITPGRSAGTAGVRQPIGRDIRWHSGSTGGQIAGQRRELANLARTFAAGDRHSGFPRTARQAWTSVTGASGLVEHKREIDDLAQREHLTFAAHGDRHHGLQPAAASPNRTNQGDDEVAKRCRSSERASGRHWECTGPAFGQGSEIRSQAHIASVACPDYVVLAGLGRDRRRARAIFARRGTAFCIATARPTFCSGTQSSKPRAAWQSTLRRQLDNSRRLL